MTNIKTKDLVKTVDTQAIKDKADCFKRGDDWYEVEPKWDRKESQDREFYIDKYKAVGGGVNIKYYKEFEVLDNGHLIGYVQRSEYKLIESLYRAQDNHIEKLEERISDLKFFLMPSIFAGGLLIGQLAIALFA